MNALNKLSDASSHVNDLSDKIFRASEIISFITDQTLKTVYRDPKNQPAPVLDWLGHKGRWGKYVYIACLTFTILHFLGLIYLKPFEPSSAMYWTFKSYSYLFHLLIILLIFIFIVSDKKPVVLDIRNSSLDFKEHREKIEYSLNRASDAIKQFFDYWPYVWVFWFLLYISLTTYHLFVDSQSIQSIKVSRESLWFFSTIFNGFNNATALIFFMLYYELSERTVNESKSQEVRMILFLFLVLIGFTEIVTSWPNRNNIESLDAISLGFSIFSGVITGVATTLLTTRFASRIFGVPPLAIVVLILYAIIQPFFPLLSHTTSLTEIIVGNLAVNIAIYGKATLVVAVHWMRSTQRLKYYMVRGLQMIEEEGIARSMFVNEFLPKTEKLLKKVQDPQNKDNSQNET